MDREKTAIDEQIKNILKKYRQVIEGEGIEVAQMLLFGSYARGTAHTWSDIDVAVISPDFGYDYFDERVRLSKMALRASSKIEPHPFHPTDLKDRWSTLASEVRRYGIVVGD